MNAVEISQEDVEVALRSHLGAEEPLSLESTSTGRFNTSWFVQHGDREFVLRVAPPDDAVFVFYERRMMRQEPEIHRLVREKTSVPVPEVVVFDYTHEVIPSDFIVFERMPGTPLSGAHGVSQNSLLEEIGRSLAAVHEIRADAFGYLGAHQPMEPQESWAEAFRIMWCKLLEDVAAVGFYDESEVTGLTTLLDDFGEVFDRPVESSLLHMDVWAENILVDGGRRLTGLIDWDRALWGDPEIEYAVLDYYGISERAFWKGYGQERDNSPGAQIRRVFYLLYEMQKYIVISEGRRRDTQRAQWHKEQVFEVISRMMGREMG